MSQFFGINLNQEPPENTKPINAQEAQAALDILIPKRSPRPLIRIGGRGDGAYLLPDDLKGISRCLSPGVNNSKHFEDELVMSHGIQCDLIDASSDVDKFTTPIIDGMQTFRKKWLDINGHNQSISISQWISSLPDGSDNLMLQMDIEGAEYRNLLATEDKDLRKFRIIILELHRLAVGVFHKVMKPLLQKLDVNFICVHAHPNNALGLYRPKALKTLVPRLLEVTFLRRDRFPQPSLSRLPFVSLPHPKDITNVPSRAPIFLDCPWTALPRSRESQARIIRDWLDFFHRHKRSDLFFAYSQLWLKYKLQKIISVSDLRKDNSSLNSKIDRACHMLSGSKSPSDPPGKDYR
jgi:hypothetical protein